MRRLSYPELTTNQTGDTHQTCSQQAEGAWLRDNDVGVTARDLGGTIEESLTSVDRQLHSHTVRVESLERPDKDTAESVVMGAVRECNQSPRHGTAEGAAEDNAVGYAVAISVRPFTAMRVEPVRVKPALVPARVPPLLLKSTLLLAKAAIGKARANTANNTIRLMGLPPRPLEPRSTPTPDTAFLCACLFPK